MMYELFWIFLSYSFLGWILETTISTAHRGRFINKGVLAGPLCCRFGFYAVFITFFSGELKNKWFFLFIGCTVISGLFDYFIGRLLEKLYQRKWWDYSKDRYNIDGYVSLKSAILGGTIGMLCISFINPLLYYVKDLIPTHISHIIIIMFFIILTLDCIWSHCAIWKLPQKLPNTEKIHNQLVFITLRLANWICKLTDKRLQNSYPEKVESQKSKEKPLVFAEGCNFYKLFWLFIIGSFLGDITETIFCRITEGVWMSRSSVVWGPFSIVWGLAIALSTLMLYNYRSKSDGELFILGTVMGGVYEYICSVFTEKFFGQVFWDYSKMTFNLGGRINLLYCFFWGIAAVVWLKKLYPYISKLIEKIPIKIGKIMTIILLIFMIANILVSALALARSGARSNGIKPHTTVDEWIDKHYGDDVMSKIYPNSKLTVK